MLNLFQHLIMQGSTLIGIRYVGYRSAGELSHVDLACGVLKQVQHDFFFKRRPVLPFRINPGLRLIMLLQFRQLCLTIRHPGDDIKQYRHNKNCQ